MFQNSKELWLLVGGFRWPWMANTGIGNYICKVVVALDGLGWPWMATTGLGDDV